jgi:cytochrome c oxidase assembly protein subunit 11
MTAHSLNVSPAAKKQGTAQRRTLGLLALVVVGMLGLAYASVPLYQLFCKVTGYGGTTQVAVNSAETVILDHPIKVRFDANVNPALKWRFEAVDKPVTLNPGEEIVINYRATNLGDTPSVGTSTFNVTPVKAGPHFMKLDCFCFIEQALAPGESVLMPVRFYIDPAITESVDTADIKEIILSYTFFPVHKATKG